MMDRVSWLDAINDNSYRLLPEFRHRKDITVMTEQDAFELMMLGFLSFHNSEQWSGLDTERVKVSSIWTAYVSTITREHLDTIEALNILAEGSINIFEVTQG